MQPPMTLEDARKRGWDELDVVFISGDAYVDHPSFGVPLLARWLEAHGLRVGVIAQPDWRSKEPFMALGKPRLFFGVAAGAMDSMVAHYTPARKLRHDDAYTPGGAHGARPNRAVIVYTSRCKEAYKDVPVVIGGVEASLRRWAHFDFWEDKLRRSILFDSKADFLIYGMAEEPLLAVAERMRKGEALSSIRDVRGSCFIRRKDEIPAAHPDAVMLPSWEEVCGDKKRFGESFRISWRQQNPHRAKTLVQAHGDRALVCLPPVLPLSEEVMDRIYDLPFEKAPHPSYKDRIPAFEQIKDSITTHRGCFGGCAFCAITLHQGKAIQSRSEASVLREVDALAKNRHFRGSISDVGGPTANMYGLACGSPEAEKVCQRESCIFPTVCRHLATSDRRAVSLLEKVRAKPGVKHVAVSSGVRYDLMEQQPAYFDALLEHHVGGLLKVAPEHLVDRITDLMRKPGRRHFEAFLAAFREESAQAGKRLGVVPYLISGHPGCTLSDMVELAFALKKLDLKVEQVQDFTPTPGTLSTAMFYTGFDAMTGEEVYVARTDREKAMQKALLLWHLPESRAKILDAFRELGRGDAHKLLGP